MLITYCANHIRSYVLISWLLVMSYQHWETLPRKVAMCLTEIPNLHGYYKILWEEIGMYDLVNSAVGVR